MDQGPDAPTCHKWLASGCECLFPPFVWQDQSFWHISNGNCSGLIHFLVTSFQSIPESTWICLITNITLKQTQVDYMSINIPIHISLNHHFPQCWHQLWHLQVTFFPFHNALLIGPSYVHHTRLKRPQRARRSQGNLHNSDSEVKGTVCPRYLRYHTKDAYVFCISVCLYI